MTDTDKTEPPHSPNTPRTLLLRLWAWLNAVTERKAWLAAVVITAVLAAVYL